MSDDARVRRAPPPWRRCAVVDVSDLTPRMRRVALEGASLTGFAEPEPAASVRLLLPGPAGLVVPTWNGNEFLLPDGSRPLLRTFTPVVVDPGGGRLVVDVVRHGGGAATDWAQTARPGDPVAVSGPGRGWTPPRGATSFVVAGDEAAIPAARQVLAALPPGAEVTTLVEVADSTARQDLTDRGSAVEWLVRADDEPGARLVDAVTAQGDSPTTAWWVAGEAAAVQRIRVHLFREVGVDRARASVRGYWKRGTAG